ncbi:MAG: bifunctional nicotinamide-nucleotide adenylyltransferase/Nudix hydroxylase [Leptospiraceae bacterium]|nr:bifunctional nicotinamide-nucleotide adenylyltransferase/Nudix hydroxylase [Leptospiraceae bacterium]
MQYELAIYIGRFQPPHIGHIKAIEYGLTIAKKILIIIGDYRSARTIKNPFYFSERKEMILRSVPEELKPRILFEPIRNFPYNDSLWVTSIQAKVNSLTETNVCIIGHQKDNSSYYLQLFPQWTFEPSPLVSGIHATSIREFFFELDDFSLSPEVNSSLSSGTISFLKEYQKTDDYNTLKEEYEFLKKYKSIWANSPYPPTFVTVDSVVLKSGHILVVKRKSSPGKGLLALPGGFVSQTETLDEGALRELIEETGIKVHKNELKNSLLSKQIFDKPDRSLRGRTITHAYFFNLGIGELPKIRGGERAEKVIWISLAEIFENMENFFEDHFSIIEYFIYKH